MEVVLEGMIVKESKFKKVSRNIVWHFVYEILIVIIGFILPAMIIGSYGSEVNGLFSTISQTVVLVSLLQAGISTAATFSLYKPIEERNIRRVNTIIEQVKRMFHKVGIFVFSIGIVASVALCLSIKTDLNRVTIYIVCLLFFAKTSFDLYISQSMRVFFTANESRYIISIGMLIGHLTYYGLTIASVLLHLPFVMMYVALFLGCLFEALFLYIFYKKQFSVYRIEKVEINSEQDSTIIGNVRDATINEVSHSAVGATIPIIISICYGLAGSSVYAIYIMSFNALLIASKTVYSSFAPSYGIVTAEGNIEKTNTVFEIFQFLFMGFTTWMFMCVSYLMLPFVSIYTKTFIDTNYINPTMMVLLMVYGCFYSFRVPYNITVSANGLFKKTRMQPFYTAIGTILLSFIITRYNYSFALIGPIIFYVINTVYQHFKLLELVPDLKTNRFWNHFLISTICISISICISFVKPLIVNNYFDWAIAAIGTAMVSALLIVIFSLIFDRSSFIKSFAFVKKKVIK